MSQAQWLLLVTKIVIIADVVTILGFVLNYTRLAPWWRDQLGRTIVIKDLLILLVELPVALSLFFAFNRLDSTFAAWFEVACLGLVAPAMIWRTVVWEKIHRKKK
jgi:hypothetical protein